MYSEAAWRRQLPSPEVASGSSRGNFPVCVHQFRRSVWGNCMSVCDKT